MSILERTFTVDKRGNLRIPAHILRDMGIAPGEHIRIAYLCEDEDAENTFHEFLLTRDGIESLPDEDIEAIGTMTVPDSLMAQAGIPPECDLTIACVSGAIILCIDEVDVDEVLDFFEEMELAPDCVGAFTVATAREKG